MAASSAVMAKVDKIQLSGMSWAGPFYEPAENSMAARFNAHTHHADHHHADQDQTNYGTITNRPSSYLQTRQ